MRIKLTKRWFVSGRLLKPGIHSISDSLAVDAEGKSRLPKGTVNLDEEPEAVADDLDLDLA